MTYALSDALNSLLLTVQYHILMRLVQGLLLTSTEPFFLLIRVRGHGGIAINAAGMGRDGRNTVGMAWGRDELLPRVIF